MHGGHQKDDVLEEDEEVIMVYDCIPFFNELDILKLRLHILDPYVDKFVIEEATVTFSGEPKELCFEKNKEMFKEFLPKIDYIVVDDSPVEAATHERDKYQKNNLIRGLRNLSEEDIIILSDVDEIPNPVELQKIIAEFDSDTVYHMAQRMFYCFLNMEEISGKLLSITGDFADVGQKQWLGTKIFSKKNIPDTGIIDIREFDTAKANSVRVDNGGWHFGYMGGKGEKDVAKRIGVKVQAAAHQEYNSQDTLAEAVDKLVLGQDIFGRDAEFVRVDIDESYPDYLREHQEEYDYLIMPPIGKGQAEYTKVSMKVKRFCRKALRKAGRIYTRAAEKITMSMVAVFAMAGLVISLLPELYLTLINRASGDDYGFGSLSRKAWVDSHSLLEVLKAAGRMVKQIYTGWQGTWFSIYLFALQPEVFHEKAYVLVTILALGVWIGVTTFVLYFFLVKTAGFEKNSFAVINALFLFINMQFIPGIKSSMFWYNGIIHYLLPYTMCLLTVYLLARYVQNLSWRYLPGILLLLGLLGGSNYQSALFAAMITVFFMVFAYWYTGKIKCFSLLLPLSVMGIGLIISMKAPGNKVRGGEDFGFSIARAAETIGMSFLEGVRQMGQYLVQKPIAVIGLLFMLIVIAYAWSKSAGGKRFPYPGLFAAAAFVIYCAMQAPEIYAGTDVSLGVANINYQTFLLMILADGIYLGGWLKNKDRLKNISFSRVVIPGAVVCVLLAGVFHSNIKETTAWKCFTYISSGQARDYKMQMDLQTAILLDESTPDAVLPFINDEQGPLMHMPATKDPEAWSNGVMRDFYGKNSVVAMERTEWKRLYGAAWEK